VITKTIKTLLRSCGFDVSRYRSDTHHGARFRHLLRTAGIRQVIDVGANEGQYAGLLRSEYGYAGDIVSFEPLPEAHARLTQRASRHSAGRWRVAPRMALGASTQRSIIHVAGNSVSSSLLPMESLHQQALPGSAGCQSEEILVQRLDDVVAELDLTVDAGTLVKVDTQGYELEVLKGAPDTIAKAGIIQAEMSLAVLYAGQPLFAELFEYITSRGFDVFDMIPGFCDTRSGRLLQIDGIFVRL